MSKVKMNLNNVTVIFAKEDEGKSTISVAITETQRDAVISKIVEAFGEEAASKAAWIPVKESEKNGLYLKAASSYPVAFYEDAVASDTVASVDQIGKEAIVDIHISIGESKYRREKGFTAYLSAVNVHEFGETERYNPFAE